MEDFRREGPRIDVDALCWEVSDEGETSAMAVDLSQGGIRIERPYVGGRTREVVPLQLDIPGIDELLWARGDVCSDIVVAARGRLGPLVRRTGYRIAMAARRDRKMLREYVFDSFLMRQRLDESGLSHIGLARGSVQV